MTGKTEEYNSKEDLKSKAQHTNRFNTSLPYSLACKCSENNDKLLNNVTCQQKCIDTSCINIILKPDIKTEHKVKEVQIVKLPVDYRNVRNCSNNQILPVISGQTTIVDGSTERNVILQSTDIILPIENNNNNNDKSYRERSATLNSLELLSAVTPQIINLTDNTSSISSQIKSNSRPLHESTRNDLGTTMYEHDVIKTVEKSISKRPMTTQTDDTPDELSKNTISSITENSMQTSSKEISSRRSVKKMKGAKSHGKLVERAKSTIRNIQAKNDRDKNASKPINVSKKLSDKNLANDASEIQRSPTNLPYESSITETSENMSETRETRVNLTQTLDPPLTNATSVSFVTSDKTPASFTDTNIISQSPEKTPKINYVDNRIAKLCFCNGPNVTPCGTKQFLTQREISRVPMSKRNDDTCICDDTDVKRAEESRRIDTSGQITDELANTGRNVMRNDCSTNIDNDTCGYDTSRIRKNMNDGIEKVDRIRSAKNPTRDKRSLPKQETKWIRSGSNLHDTKDRNLLVSSNVFERESGIVRHGVKETKDMTGSQSVEILTDVASRQKVEEKVIKYKSHSVTASDFTRPEFVRILTEIKEQTCNLERQLAAMNDAMKGKEQSTIGNVNERLLDDDKIDLLQDKRRINVTVERINRVVDRSNVCTSDHCEGFHIRQNVKHVNPDCHDEQIICTSPAVASQTDTSVSIDKHEPLAVSSPVRSQVKSKDIRIEDNLNISYCIKSAGTLAPSLTYKQSNVLICPKTNVPDNTNRSTTTVERSIEPILTRDQSKIDPQRKTSNANVPQNDTAVINVRSSVSKEKSKKPVFKTKQKSHGCSPINFRRATANQKRRDKGTIDKSASVDPSKINLAQSRSILHEESIPNNLKLVSTGCVTESNVSRSSLTARPIPNDPAASINKSSTIGTNNNLENAEQSSPATTCVDCQSSNSHIVAATLVTSIDFQPVITSSKIYEEKATQSDKKLTFTSKILNVHDTTLKSIDIDYNINTPSISDRDITSRLDSSEFRPEHSSTRYNDLLDSADHRKEINNALQDDRTSLNCNNERTRDKNSNVDSLRTAVNSQHADLAKDSNNGHRDNLRSFSSFDGSSSMSTSKMKNRAKSAHGQLAKFRSRIPLLKTILRMRDARQRRNSLPAQSLVTKESIAIVTSTGQLTLERLAKLPATRSTGTQQDIPCVAGHDTPFSYNVCRNSEEELSLTDYENNCKECKHTFSDDKDRIVNVVANADKDQCSHVNCNEKSNSAR